MNTLSTSFALIGLVLAIGGCATRDYTEAPKAANRPIILQKGMSADEVHDLLGEPISVREEANGIETWTYEDYRESTRLVQADTQEVPYIHPVSREATTRIEAVTKTRTDRITLTTDLRFYNGKLIGWEESTRESTFYHD